MMLEDSLVIQVEDHGSHELYEKLLAATQDKEYIHIKIVPPKGPQASILLLIATPVVVAFAEGFFSKLGEIAAEELIKVFKDIKKAQKEPQLITVGAKKKETGEYSLHHSFCRPSHNGKTIKFVFKKTWSMEEFNSACIIMMRELRLYENHKPNQIESLINDNNPIAGYYLFSINLDDSTLYKVNIK